MLWLISRSQIRDSELLVKMFWSVQETLFFILPVFPNTGIESLPLSYITSFPQQRYASFVKKSPVEKRHACFHQIPSSSTYVSYANNIFSSSSSTSFVLPPVVVRPRSPFLALRSITASARLLYLALLATRTSRLTWLGETNSLFS
jgi:hypothetical protein